MRDIQTCFKTCVLNLKSIDIPIAKRVRVKVNTRARSRWGQAQKQEDGSFIIEISNLLLDERCPEESLLSTIYHELIHTCEDCFNHGVKWNTYVAKASKALHVDITYGATAQEKLKNPQLVAEVINDYIRKRKTYVVECSVCHVKSIYHKKVNVSNYCCGKCKSSALIIYQI